MGLCTADYVFWIWGVFDSYLETENADTIDEFLVVLCWSLQALFSGKHPTHDHGGVQHFGLPLFVVLAGIILLNCLSRRFFILFYFIFILYECFTFLPDHVLFMNNSSCNCV